MEITDYWLTLKAVSIKQFLALLVNFDPTLGAPHALACEAPEEALTLVAVGGRGGRPHLELMGGGAGDGVDQGL